MLLYEWMEYIVSVSALLLDNSDFAWNLYCLFSSKHFKISCLLWTFNRPRTNVEQECARHVFDRATGSDRFVNVCKLKFCSRAKLPRKYFVRFADALHWPLGSCMAQAAHAATAVIWQTRDTTDTAQYMNDTDKMHKVVLQVGTFCSVVFMVKS